MTKVLLDLCCGDGGAAKGYAEVGYSVVGVDIVDKPRYPFQFVKDDVLRILRDDKDWCAGFDLIHASPPCQAFTKARTIHGREHPDVLTPCRELLEQLDVPWVIENVPGAPMRTDLMLCGSMFPELSSIQGGELRRHRLFEFSDAALVPPQPNCKHKESGTYTVSVFGHGGHIYKGVEEWREVMGIDWMGRDGLAQAIPPPYTRYIGAYVKSLISFQMLAA